MIFNGMFSGEQEGKGKERDSMSLIPEWRHRIDHWQRVIQTLFYRPLGEVKLSAFTTMEHLAPAEAARGEFAPVRPGKAWGKKWEYMWLRGSFVLPKAARGRRVVLQPQTGGESAVFLDGNAVGTVSWGRKEAPVTRRGVAGKKYSVLIESYAGHGPQECGGGPCPHGRETVPEPSARQKQIGTTTFGIWEEDAYQLWLDVQTLLELRDSIGQQSLRVQEIDAGLRDYSLICDLELPHEEMTASVRAARKRLRPLLACRNGSTSPLLYCSGHAHIDVAWLWPLQETDRKTCRTFSTQLELIDEYPGYRFLQSQPYLYRVAKELYPAVYRRVKSAVKKGQIIPEGGMWVEADTNVTGGEALIRQFLHGKRFFREEFGLDNELLWLPDVFGYSAALPQILAGCGIKYFSTSKIFWNYNEGEPFPYNTFFWEGIDGTRILSHFITNYNSQTSPRNMVSRWDGRVQKEGIKTRLVSYGHGDGGGGPTRSHIEFLLRQKDLEGAPRCVMASPNDFFRDQERDSAHLPVYVGELYLQLHRGTFTSQAKTKKGNRRSELALREAEMWGAIAGAIGRGKYPLRRMDEAWECLLMNQFHDILPGSSIARVYEEAEAAYAAIEAEANEVAAKSARALVRRRKNALTVFNSLSWRRSALVELPKGFRGAVAADGNALAVQKVGNSLVAEVPGIPSCGWTSVRKGEPARTANTLRITSRDIENELLRIRLNAQGQITSIRDKETGRQLAAGPCNHFRMYKDVPSKFDAWDIDITYKSAPVELSGTARVKVLDKGPLVARLQVERKLHNSTMKQVISLRRGSRRVDFATTIDWQESHKLLKVNFPVDIRSDEAIHEIQFGHLSRPTHESRQYDADRFEVPQHKWTALSEQNRGCAILNDSKYGISVDGNSINLTLLKSGLAPDMTADKGVQEFTYSFYAWNGTFGESDVIREAYDLNVPVLAGTGYADEESVFSVDAPNIVIETVKPAADGSGDVAVRLYETKRMSAKCRLKTSFPVASAMLTDMLEENGRKLRVTKKGEITLSFRPFEIKTVRLQMG